MTMRALSVRQPFAWLLVHGHKTREDRTWATDHRGPLAIHASARLAPDADQVIATCRDLGIPIPDADQLPRGAIVGTVDLRACTGRAPRFAWTVANGRPCAPIPMRGQLALWNAPVNPSRLNAR